MIDATSQERNYSETYLIRKNQSDFRLSKFAYCVTVLSFWTRQNGASDKAGKTCGNYMSVSEHIMSKPCSIVLAHVQTGSVRQPMVLLKFDYADSNLKQMGLKNGC